MSFFRRKPTADQIEVSVHTEVTFASDADRIAALTAARESYQQSKGELDEFIERRYGPAPYGVEDLAPPTVCPTCGAALEKPVSKTRKCSDCGAKMVYRTFDSEKRLLTEEQAKEVDAYKSVVADTRKAFRRVENIGVGVAQFTDTFESLGPGYSARDASWRVLNDQALEAMKLGDFHRLKMAYHLQAGQLSDEGRGYIEVLGFAREAELLEIKSAGVFGAVEILGCECSACAPDGNKTLRWDEFTAGQFGPVGPLPHESCERRLCTCSYVGVTPDLGF